MSCFPGRTHLLRCFFCTLVKLLFSGFCFHTDARLRSISSCILCLTAIPESIFAPTECLLPSSVCVSELMTEKPQTNFAGVAAPGRPMEQHNIVWRDIVPNWAEGLTSWLYKLSSVASAFCMPANSLLSGSPSPLIFHICFCICC